MMPSWLQKMSRDCARSLRHIRKAGEPMRSLLLSRANDHSYRQSREFAKGGQYTFLLLIQLSYLLTWNISINKNLVLPVPIHHHRRSFFFSSRRRHTRSDRDWSSDVCSSD